MWVGIGFLITVVPVIIVGFIILTTKKYDFGSICGILCGSMANPMALTYANETLDGDTPSISYATVYPLGMFIRVIIAQVIIMFFVYILLFLRSSIRKNIRKSWFQLEISLSLYRYFLTRQGMFEGNLLGM